MCKQVLKKKDRSTTTIITRIDQNEDVSNLISLASSNPAVLSKNSTQGELRIPLSTFGQREAATKIASLRQQTTHTRADEDF